MADKRKSIKDIINKLSFLKIAGINRLIFVDVYSSVVKLVCLKSKEPFYKIKIDESLQKIEVTASEYHTIDDDYSLIKSHLKKFVEKYDLKDSYVVVGINDYKFNLITLPNDVEDIESWFSDNSSKFLPEGRPANEFHFSYEQYNEDENSMYFFVVVARADLIAKVHESCNIDSIHLLNVSPFSLSFHSFIHCREKNVLFLDFTNGKLLYTLVNISGNIFNGEFYYKTEKPSAVINTDSMRESMEELYVSLEASLGEKNLDKPEIYLVCNPGDGPVLKELITTIFNPESFNSGYEALDTFYTGSYLIYNKLMGDYDAQVNFLSKELTADERFLLEKQIGMRTVLIGGLILIMLLMFSYFTENFRYG